MNEDIQLENFDNKNLLGLKAEELPELEQQVSEKGEKEFQSMRKEQGLIIVADDQMIMLESIQSSIKRIDALDVTEFYANGQQVIDRVIELTDSAIKKARCFPICPVRIVLLDYQMPQKTGLEVVIALKKYYNDLIEKYDQSLTADLFITQPVFIFLSAHFSNKQFVDHARKIGVKFFFTKPLQDQQLKYLMKLI